MPSTQPDEEIRRRRRFAWWLAIAVVVVFAPSVFGSFVSDDMSLIVRNPYAQSWEYLGRCFRSDLFDVPTRLSAENWVRFYRPVVTASYLINWKLSGGAAWTFHVVNVLAHLGAVLLAFRMASRWTGDSRLGFFVALVFAIHPTRNESVLWISGRTDVFMALFLLLALETLVAAARRPPGKSWPLWIGGLVAWVAALLSKEYAIILPLLLGVEALLISADKDRRPERSRLVFAGAASVLGAASYLALRSHYMPIRPEGLSSASLDFGTHVTYVLLTVGRYLMRAVFPWPQVLTFRPIFAEQGHVVFPVLDTGLGVLAVGAFVGALLWLVRRRRLDAGVIAAAGLAFLPIANVSYTGFNSTTSDRFFYFPLLLVVAACTRLVPRSWLVFSWSLPRAAMAIGLALVCLAISWTRALDFTSDRAFWEQEAAVNPNNPIALAALAEVHTVAGEHDEAYRYLHRAYSPESRKYILVADPTRYYIYLLGMQANRLPDGAVRELDALTRQLAALARGELRRTDEVVGDLPLDAPMFDENVAIWIRGERPIIACKAAMGASRLGQDALVREMAAIVSDDDRVDGWNRRGLAVALTRAGDYDGARHQVELIRTATLGGIPEEALQKLLGDIEKVRGLRGQAAASSEPDASLLSARADSTMAGWLRAARTLRGAFVAFPADEPVWSAYVQALFYSRLDDDAYDVARARLDDTGAKAHLQDLATRLSPGNARARPIPRGTRWW